jgi:hypothetical protein
VIGREPCGEVARAVLVQPTVRVDTGGTRSQRSAAQGRIVMLCDGEDRSSGGMRFRDGEDTVIGPRRQVDDDVIDSGKGRCQRGKGPDRDDLSSGAPHEIGEAGRPDQVIGQDGDARGQSSISAR